MFTTSPIVDETITHLILLMKIAKFPYWGFRMAHRCRNYVSRCLQWRGATWPWLTGKGDPDLKITPDYGGLARNQPTSAEHFSCPSPNRSDYLEQKLIGDLVLLQKWRLVKITDENPPLIVFLDAMIDGNWSKKFTTFQGSGHLCMKELKNHLINKRMADHENNVSVSV